MSPYGPLAVDAQRVDRIDLALEAVARPRRPPVRRPAVDGPQRADVLRPAEPLPRVHRVDAEIVELRHGQLRRVEPGAARVGAPVEAGVVRLVQPIREDHHVVMVDVGSRREARVALPAVRRARPVDVEQVHDVRVGGIDADLPAVVPEPSERLLGPRRVLLRPARPGVGRLVDADQLARGRRGTARTPFAGWTPRRPGRCGRRWHALAGRPFVSRVHESPPSQRLPDPAVDASGEPVGRRAVVLPDRRVDARGVSQGRSPRRSLPPSARRRGLSSTSIPPSVDRYTPRNPSGV